MCRRWRFHLFASVLFAIPYFVHGEMEVINTTAAILPSDLTAVIPLSVVSYNIRGCRDDGGQADVNAIATEIVNLRADVIALQEVDSGLPRSHFVQQANEIANQIGMNYVYSPAIDFVVGTYGNALLSRFPIVSAQTILLPSFGEQRGLIDATLDINGVQLRIFATHLGLKKSERLKQIDFLHEYVKSEQMNKKQLAILLGDFNMNANDELFHPISQLFQNPLDSENMLKHAAKHSGYITYGIIDHIFLSDGVALIEEKPTIPGRSDHLPVGVTVMISDPGVHPNISYQ